MDNDLDSVNLFGLEVTYGWPVLFFGLYLALVYSIIIPFVALLLPLVTVVKVRHINSFKQPLCLVVFTPMPFISVNRRHITLKFNPSFWNVQLGVITTGVTRWIVFIGFNFVVSVLVVFLLELLKNYPLVI